MIRVEAGSDVSRLTHVSRLTAKHTSISDNTLLGIHLIKVELLVQLVACAWVYCVYNSLPVLCVRV